MVAHVEKRLDYGYGTVAFDHPVEADAVNITGSRRNVSMWEPWMDDVVDLIRSSGGSAVRHLLSTKSSPMRLVGASLEPQRTRILWRRFREKTAGQCLPPSLIKSTWWMPAELVIASAAHCDIAACRPSIETDFHRSVPSRGGFRGA